MLHHEHTLFSVDQTHAMAGPRMSWPLVRVNTQGDPNQSRYYADEKKDVNVEVNSIRSGGGDSQIIGSSELFDENGNIRLIPVSYGPQTRVCYECCC